MFGTRKVDGGGGGGVLYDFVNINPRHFNEIVNMSLNFNPHPPNPPVEMNRYVVVAVFWLLHSCAQTQCVCPQPIYEIEYLTP